MHIKTTDNRTGVTLLIVLAMMVMFAMLITTFMVVVSQNRHAAENNARRLVGPELQRITLSSRSVYGPASGREYLDQAVQLLLSGDDELRTVIGPYSILENLYAHPQSEPFSGDIESLVRAGYGLRPNVLAPEESGRQLYKEYLQNAELQGDAVRMNPGYTFPDHANLFLAWNDLRRTSDGWEIANIIPSFHRPNLIPNDIGLDLSSDQQKHHLRRYVLRPLPTDHPNFTGSNTPVSSSLTTFLKEGPWDVDNDGDGVRDSVWLDIGLPVQYDEQSQSYYKPLVAFYVVDMDGRINVNTIGNLAQYKSESNEDSVTHSIAGMGIGAAELVSDLIPQEVLLERYGQDGMPGIRSDLDLLRYNGIHWDSYTKGHAKADWAGTTPIRFDHLGNHIPAEIEVTPDTLPYLMNPYTNREGDRPFSSRDLESLVRSVLDRDYALLPQDFRNSLGDPYHRGNPSHNFAAPELRYSLTTRSSDVPVSPVLDADWLMPYLPEEIREGRKVNLNRLTLSPNWDVHWKTNATQAERNALLKEKVQFAQEMFYLARVVLGDEIRDAETLRRLAQWSVNLVDFIDPDDVMTPFIYRTDSAGTITPFDNASLIDRLLAGTLTAQDLVDNNAILIWGMEKPEVLISETLAVHNRRVRIGMNLQRVQEGTPEGSLFVELYRQGNPHSDYSASSLVDPWNRDRINLAAKTRESTDRNGNFNGEFYVWRLAIGEMAKSNPGSFSWRDDSNELRNGLRMLLDARNVNVVRYPQFNQWSYRDPSVEGRREYAGSDLGTPERFIWFAPEPIASIELPGDPNRGRSFYADSRNTGNRNSVHLTPHTHLVLTPWLSPPASNHPGIELYMPFENTVVVSQAAGEQNLLNASEPINGYGMPTAGNPPLDDGRTGRIGFQLGTIPCFKTICLQRLADPNRAHHPLANPYITVDWSMIDLHVINSEDREGEAEKQQFPSTPMETAYLSSRDWNRDSAPRNVNIGDRTLPGDVLAERKAGLPTGGTWDNMTHTLGAVNFGTTTRPILHFPWNDAPLMNTGELMLVPSTAPGRWSVEYHDSAIDYSSGGESRTKNFFGDSPGDPLRFGYDNRSPYWDWTSDGNSPRLSMNRLFEYVHVPSLFSGARFPNAIAGMREPGKMNLNTLNEAGWEALQSGRNHFPAYESFNEYRRRVMSPNLSQEAGKKFPSSLAVLLDFERSNNAFLDNQADHPYTVLENLMRLSDVTTTRSNVFAVWITVGYFQVEKFSNPAGLRDKYPELTHINSQALFDAVYPDGYVLGPELGYSNRTHRRHRAFYLIDRSTYVEYHRGDTEHYKNVIIAETMLE